MGDKKIMLMAIPQLTKILISTSLDKYSLAKFAIFSHFRLQTGNGYHFSKILILTSLNKNFITA